MPLPEWMVDISTVYGLYFNPLLFQPETYMTTPAAPQAEADTIRALKAELDRVRKEARLERDKFWKLATRPNAVLGEAHATASGIQLTYIGEGAPEEKLGLAPGTFPKTIDDNLALMHPDDRERYRQRIQHAVATGEPYDITYRLSDSRGGWRWIAGRAVSVGVREGKYFDWIFTAHDFTAQQETESTLSQSLKELVASRSELKNEHDKLWRLAANTFSLLGEARVTEQGMALEFFGDVPPEEKLGITGKVDFSDIDRVVAFMHPDDIAPFRLRIQQAIAGQPFQLIYRLADGRGGWRWLKGRACSVEERDNKHVRFLHDTVDITEQMQIEEALRKSVAQLEQLKTQLQKENLLLREGCHGDEDDISIIGQSAPLNRVLQQVQLVAATTATVLIGGETGTGKELVARAIHRGSVRQGRLFVSVNCAALPATLVESELFGHEKGAFTGANARRMGRFEQADKGTLFLDEIGELPLETQSKLLRVLQSGEFERVGGDKTLKMDVRIIAASNRDLEQAVREGLFRSDLYHRLAVFPIDLPPLRDRREDIPLLAAYIVARHARKLGRKIDRIEHSVLDRLTAYHWPGNVRELENVLERAIILTSGTSLQLETVNLGPRSVSHPPVPHARSASSSDAPTSNTLQECEREHILRVCAAAGWKIKGEGGAAQRLGLNPGTLYSRMKKLGIRRP
jgi:transcriptional regulator with GAF, ATPase, and Fis domain